MSNEKHTHDRSGGWFRVAVVALLAIVALRVGPGAPSVALGEMTVDKGAYSMMTTDGGNDEVLVVIDSRAETVMVYRVAPNGGLDMLEREALSALFTRARAQALGRP